MKRRLFFLLPTLASVGLLLGGCSSTGSSFLSYDANKPQTFLAGAEVEQAKSLAMGSAVTKGWEIVNSSDNRLVVSRPLSAAAAQAIAGESVSTASLEVSSEFYERQDGVDVVVNAALIANSGSKSQRRIDFTDSYKDDLNQSLNSLQRSWNENRWRVASATPPLPTKVVDPESGNIDGASSTSDSGAQSVDSSGAYAADRGVQAASTVPAAAGAAAIVTSTSSSPAAPIEDRYSTAPPPPAPAATSASPSENMMVLNRTGQQGVWTYYAEHYAKIRGCELSDSGAVLQEKKPEFEIHRVYCEDEKTFLVKCNAGTCRGLE